MVEGSLDVEVPSHDARVVGLRPVTDVPSFLGWNRQISMGGTLLHEARWDEAAQAMVLGFDAVPGTDLAPFTWAIAVWRPDGYALSEHVFAGGSVQAVEVIDEDEVVRVRFEPDQVGPLTLTLTF